MEYSILTRHILIIEDNPGDFVLIKEYLNEEFFEVIIDQAKTFTEAKIKLQEAKVYDTILLDLSLPDANGAHLISEMVRLAAFTPIIVLTGYTDKDFSIKTLSLGISDYLLKDELTAAHLYKSITYSIERSRINKELIESEENYRNLFDLSPVAMWVYNLETFKFINVNKAAIEHYGYSKNDFLGMTLFDLQPNDDIENNKLEMQFLEEGIPVKNNFRHLKKNGDLINVEVQRSIYSVEQKTGLALSTDVTTSFYQKSILDIEKKVYELNATGDISFKHVLEIFTNSIEAILPTSFCVILQKNDDGTLHNLIVHNSQKDELLLNEDTSPNTIDSPITSTILTGNNCIVGNIDEDKKWEKYSVKIKPFGFKACWCVPIKKSDGTILGSFTSYFKTIKHPLPHHINLLERAAALLGILLENRNAVDNIKKWNERYDIVSKATSDIIWDWNFENNKIFWNKGLKNVMGYDELQDTTTLQWRSDRIHAEDIKRVTENINYHINNRIVKWQDAYRFLCIDGTYKYVLDRGFLLFNADNIAIRMIGAMQDISRQKEEEHQLKLLGLVITNASDAVMITEVNFLEDSDHKIVYINEAFTKMTGYAEEDVIGKNPSFFQGPKTNRMELRRLKKSIKKWERCEIEIINYKVNGEEFWNNIAISPVADSTGRYTHWIAIERDVTLRKKKDQDITKAIINAQEHERLQIGGELHDNVNQILAGVLLNLGMTKSRPIEEQSDWIDKSVGYIHLAIKEIRSLSHQLAPLSIDENSLETTFDTFLKSININNQFVIKFYIDEVGSMHVDGDIQLNLYRILQEQSNNIMKYSEATIIEVTLMLVNKCIKLRIFDNGIGFDTKKNRNGIGINNIRKRAELFSGNFLLRSAPGKGCEVIVEIPIMS